MDGNKPVTNLCLGAEGQPQTKGHYPLKSKITGRKVTFKPYLTYIHRVYIYDTSELNDIKYYYTDSDDDECNSDENSEEDPFEQEQDKKPTATSEVQMKNQVNRTKKIQP